MKERVRSISTSTSEVSILPITQATTATFTDLYFTLTFLFFIQTGSKRVICPYNGELIGEAGDLLVFPPGLMVTMENRPILNDRYRADGVCFSHELVENVFADGQSRGAPPGVQRLPAKPHNPGRILSLLKETLNGDALPPPIKRHRLLEPLIWLQHSGMRLPTHKDEQPLSQVRDLIETDLTHPWRIPEVANQFAISEATFRRWLSRSGQSFSKILLNTRLEKGLSRLQTTDVPISQIALECGFKTPSHFSDSFKKRFGIPPSAIRSVAA